jgi:hypothetical protein
MMDQYVDLAARSYDEVMLEDSPLGGAPIEPDR